MPTWFPKPRWKQYAAQSGYVYNYLFEGFVHAGEHGAEEYSFSLTAGPAVETRVSVALELRVLEEWAAGHRPLTDIERYGIAKMALLAALDESASPQTIPSPVRPALETVARICAELDL